MFIAKLVAPDGFENRKQFETQASAHKWGEKGSRISMAMFRGPKYTPRDRGSEVVQGLPQTGTRLAHQSNALGPKF